MKTYPQTLIDKKNALHGTDPFVWLFEIEIERTAMATTVIRRTPYQEAVTWNSMVFKPMPMGLSTIQDDDKGTLQEIVLTLTNIGGEMASFVAATGGLPQAIVTPYLVNIGALSVTTPLWSGSFEVAGISVTREGVALRLALPALIRELFPQHIFNRSRCPWIFRGSECRYQGSTYTTCNKTLSDCELRGADEFSGGHAKMHPRKFGGFPGMPSVKP
jgi:phage-related protein